MVNLTQELFHKIHKNGLNVNTFFVLLCKYQKEKLKDGLSYNLYEMSLLGKGFLDLNFAINQKGIDVIEKILEKKKEKFDFKSLEKNLKRKMFELIGSENIIVSNKLFIPGHKTLELRLKKASKIFDFTICKKVEKVLLQHIIKANDCNFEKIRTIEYFILGQNFISSDLADALNRLEVDDNLKINEFKKINTKSLFE